MKKLRLVLNTDCNRNCEGCCNKDWDLENLEIATDYAQYDEILLTGGEPMLYPDHIERVVGVLREQTVAPIYLYTAKIDDTFAAMKILEIIDGITITLHEYKDGVYFRAFKNFLPIYFEDKSLRLNVFKGAGDYGVFWNTPWKIKEDMEWIKDSPLPEGESLKRYQ